MKKKRDKIDGLFKDYFRPGSKAHEIESFRVEEPNAVLYESMAMCYESSRDIPEKECPDSVKIGVYIDRALDKNAMLELDQHFAVCEKCRAKARDAKAAIEKFEKNALPEVPRSIAFKNLSCLAKKNPRSPKK